MTVSHILLLTVSVALAASSCKSTATPSASKPAGTPQAPVVQPSAGLPRTAIDWAPLPAEPREAQLAAVVAELLPRDHLRKAKLDDRLSQVAFKQYMKRLDGRKLFLLQSHADALASQSALMDDQMRAGNLLLSRFGSAILLRRVAVVEEAVAKLLSKPFDFTLKESLETDIEKRQFATTEQALVARWRRVLKVSVLERVARMESLSKSLRETKADSKADKEKLVERLAEIPESAEAREEKARKELADSYSGRFSRLKKLEPLEPAGHFLNAVAAAYGPHTLYLAPAKKENFDIGMTGSLEGIGAVLAESDHYITVRELVPGGASWRQGELEAGDLIIAVGQQSKKSVDVADMRINDVVKMIRGPRGTVVTLTVKKPDDRVETIAIKRDVIEIESAFARGAVLRAAGKPAVGYVQLPSFYGSRRSRAGKRLGRTAAKDVRKIVELLAQKKVPGLIIDLRGNGGGLLSAAIEISGLFIDSGPIVKTRRSDGATELLSDEDAGVAFDGHVVVLVNRTSASASEILAAALQDYKRAVVVGPGPTHGKGTVQTIIDMDRVLKHRGAPLGMLKLTIQQFYGVDGESTQWKGVVPDILLPDPFAHVELGERFHEHSMPADTIPRVAYKEWAGAKYDLVALSAASQHRVQKVAEFSKLEQRAAYLEKRRKDTEVPLERSAWLARREQDKKALEAFETEESNSSGKSKKADKPELFKVRMLEPLKTESDPSRKGSRKAKREAWTKATAGDPWLAESLQILSEMVPTK